MKDKTLDELEHELHHQDSIAAGDELLRRMREAIPLLETLAWAVFNERPPKDQLHVVQQAIALVEEAGR